MISPAQWRLSIKITQGATGIRRSPVKPPHGGQTVQDQAGLLLLPRRLNVGPKAPYSLCLA
jgi:hypothetical protein